MEIITLLSGVGGLVKTAFEIWHALEQRQRKVLEQAEMDRLKSVKKRRPKPMPPREVDALATPSLERLQDEATQLQSFVPHPSFEVLDTGVGIAVDLGEDGFVAFWLPPEYPRKAPSMLLLDEGRMTEVGIDDAAWSESLYLADVVEAIQEAA